MLEGIDEFHLGKSGDRALQLEIKLLVENPARHLEPAASACRGVQFADRFRQNILTFPGLE